MKKIVFIVVLLASLLAGQLVTAQSVTITPGTSPICFGAGSSVTLTATPTGGMATNYQWLDNNSITISNGFTDFVTVSPVNVGTYTYTVIVSWFGGGTSTSTATVIVNPTPVPIVTVNDATLCQGETAILTSTISGQWYHNGTIITGATGITYSTQQAGTYVVSVTVGGCHGENTGTNVTVNPLPDAGFTPNIELEECSDAVTPFTANLIGPQYTYQWYRSINPINGSNQGTAIFGATSSSYIPLLFDPQTEETYYYSLKITNNTTGCSSTW